MTEDLSRPANMGFSKSVRALNYISKIILTISFVSCAGFGRSTASESLDIQLYKVTESEKKAKKLLLDLSTEYDLSKYMFTSKILIRSGVIPHSHPILTLNTRLVSKTNIFLSTYLHEQIHWYFTIENNEEQVEKFVSRMKTFYPSAPVGNLNGGAKSKHSTYLHFH